MRARGVFRLVAGLAVLAQVAGGPRAEVATDHDGTRVRTLLMASITDDADPVPQGVLWDVYRNLPPDCVLNPSGEIRRDGRPDVAWQRGSGWPYVVWAYNGGNDHDIAYSAWTGSGWSAVTFLTSGTRNELDPRIHVTPAGQVHAVWWIAGSVPEVVLSGLPSASDLWSTPARLSSNLERARRPSVVVFEGVLRVAYERDSLAATGAQQVVIRRAEPDGGFPIEHVIPVDRVAPLEPLLASNGQILWVSWQNGETELGVSTLGVDGWSVVDTTPWDDSSWLGLETARRAAAHVAVDRATQETFEQPPP